MKLKVSHNLNDVQLEEALEKALGGLRPYLEPNRDYPDHLANQVKAEANASFEKIAQNMLAEIQAVMEQK